MQIFYVIAAFLACTVAPSAAERKRCDQLPTNISSDARLAMQPRGKKWMMYKATAATHRCLTISYDGNRNNNQQLATLTFWKSQDNVHYPTKVDVNLEMTSWIITNDTGASLKFHKLVQDDNNQWWCNYGCDAKGEKIHDAFCGVLDDKGKEELDAELAQKFPDKDLPLMDGQTLAVVYDKNCKTKSS